MHPTVLITGASSGIGLEMARIFAKKGYHLCLVARSIERLTALQKELQASCDIDVSLCIQDLSMPNAAQKIYAQFASKPIDILVNNAGFGDYGLFHHSDLTKAHNMCQVNMIALTELTHLFLPQMLERAQGKILNVGSMAGFQPGPFMSVYYATKAYVLSFSEALSNELKNTGVTVSVLCPGPTHTGFAKVARFKSDRLFKGLPTDDAYQVAIRGIDGLFKNKVIIVPGWMQRFTTFLPRLLPRFLVRNIVQTIQTNR